MRKETKLRKKKKRDKAIKLIQKGFTYSDVAKGQKFLKQVNRVPYGHGSKSNY